MHGLDSLGHTHRATARQHHSHYSSSTPTVSSLPPPLYSDVVRGAKNLIEDTKVNNTYHEYFLFTNRALETAKLARHNPGTFADMAAQAHELS